MNKEEIPISSEVLAKVKKMYNFDELDVACAVRANKLTEMSTTYYIM